MPVHSFPRLLGELAELLLPVACPGCGVAGPAPCQRCLDTCRSLTPLRVAAQRPLTMPVTAAGAYGGVLRRLVLAHKERGRRGLTPPLGQLLAGAVVASLEGTALLGGCPEARGSEPPDQVLVLVPVPSLRSAVRSRGEDTVAVLARSAAVHLTAAGTVTTSRRWLSHRHAIRDQAGLSAAQRRTNVAGALQVSSLLPEIPARHLVVIVDDVTTTGSTMAESWRALTGAGVPVVSGATVAAAAPRSQAPQQ